MKKMASRAVHLLSLGLLLLLVTTLPRQCTAMAAAGQPGRRARQRSSCPIDVDALQFRACLSVRRETGLGAGGDECCSLLAPLADDLDAAAACLCAVVREQVLLSILNFVVPIDMSFVFNRCGANYPLGSFLCR
ncbi:hypothetical protein BRADI_3g59002v3 [Brachypodium distachyon]|uniref:Bifunctional inhibitor/plant lipid transfer protein/seed storage helical domain-containing protein n=1 Tax=Brachypodium distachyon TaxID=15368 RepID=A0A2K2D5S8_BRADI|nr:hypothetical protein BRADI_3g59002v3 [Brachypodium distachyon]